MGNRCSAAPQHQMRAAGLFLLGAEDSHVQGDRSGSCSQSLVRPLSPHKPGHFQKKLRDPRDDFLSAACCADHCSQGAVPSEAEEGRVALADMNVVTPLVGWKLTPLVAARVHAEKLQGRHRGKEVLANQSREKDQSPSRIKPGREVLMDGAVHIGFQR